MLKATVKLFCLLKVLTLFSIHEENLLNAEQIQNVFCFYKPENSFFLSLKLKFYTFSHI